MFTPEICSYDNLAGPGPVLVSTWKQNFCRHYANIMQIPVKQVCIRCTRREAFLLEICGLSRVRLIIYQNWDIPLHTSCQIVCIIPLWCVCDSVVRRIHNAQHNIINISQELTWKGSKGKRYVRVFEWCTKCLFFFYFFFYGRKHQRRKNLMQKCSRCLSSYS